MHSRIQQVRTEAELSLREFGKRLGISASSIQKLENGTNNPSEQTIRAICSEFKVRRAWLVNGDEPMYEPQDAFASQVRIMIPEATDQVVDFFKALVETPNGLDTFIEVCERYHEIAKEKEAHD